MITDVLPSQLMLGACGAYVAEASELKGQFDPARGLTVRSANGNRVVYWVAHEEIDSEGELKWWDLQAWSQGYPPITVFND